MDFKGKAKWDAWSSKKGMGQEEAKQKYIEYANTMKEKHGLSGTLGVLRKEWVKR